MLDIVTPMVSLIVGALITYAANVRVRKRTHVEDLFRNAISAVAVADASQYFMASIARPAFLDDESYAELVRRMNTEAVENHVRKVAEAREALARLLPYQPAVKQFYEGPIDTVYRQTDEIVGLLNRGPMKH